MLKSKFYLSLKIIQHLATAESPVTMATLAETVEVSESYIEQLLVNLRHGGITIGTKGPGGGQKLVDGALIDLRLIDLGKIVCPDDLNADDPLMAQALRGMVLVAIRDVTATKSLSCFGKRLGVEACTHGCPVADECYEQS